MAWAIEGRTRFTPPDLPIKVVFHYRKADPYEIAKSEMRMEDAARAYWAKYQETKDISQAEAVAQGMLTHDEFESYRFEQIWKKRRP
jgi:hypothetical protein